jgi:hypothetical protein
MQHNRSGPLKPEFYSPLFRHHRRCFNHFLPLSRHQGGPPQREATPSASRTDPEFWAMTTFDKREEAFEKKFALDEEQKFKAVARRNKLLGMWVAGQLGLSGDAAGAYAKEVIVSEFDEAGDSAVVRKVSGDLAAKGISVTQAQIDAKMNELMAEAIVQVKAGI